MASPVQLSKMMEIYGFPSQSYWRAFEIDVLRTVSFERPILEIGCSDGGFTREACGFVEVAIDINPRSLERAKRSGVFGTVRLQDARTLDDKENFQTVLFNSVIEHIPDPITVLEGAYRALAPGAQVVLTIPLVDMESHLTWASAWWRNLRRKTLVHVNLLTLEEWTRMLESVGFKMERTQRYLTPEQIKLWDKLDGIGMIGTSRINLAAVCGKLSKLVPGFVRTFVNPLYTRMLRKRLVGDGTQNGCAALFVARKPLSPTIEVPS